MLKYLLEPLYREYTTHIARIRNIFQIWNLKLTMQLFSDSRQQRFHRIHPDIDNVILTFEFRQILEIQRFPVIFQHQVANIAFKISLYGSFAHS